MKPELYPSHQKQLLTATDVMMLFSISATTLWRHVKDGRIPKPFYVGKARYWHFDELMAFVASET